MPPRRRPRRARARLALARSPVVAVTTVAGLLVSTGAVFAAPTPAELEKQIDDAWNQLEPIIEQYNQVHTQLKEINAGDRARSMVPTL